MDSTPEVPGRPGEVPGDEVPPGTPNAGEDLCPQCGGSGKQGEGECPACAGRGTVQAAVGGG